MKKQFTTNAIVGIIDLAYFLESWTVVVDLMSPDSHNLAHTAAHQQRKFLSKLPNPVSGTTAHGQFAMITQERSTDTEIVSAFQSMFDALNALCAMLSKNQAHRVVEWDFNTYQKHISTITNLSVAREAHSDMFNFLMRKFGEDQVLFDKLATELRSISVLRYVELVNVQAAKF